MFGFLVMFSCSNPITKDLDNDSADTAADTDTDTDTDTNTETGDTEETGSTSCSIDDMVFRAEVRSNGVVCQSCSNPIEVVGVVTNPCTEAFQLPLTQGCLVSVFSLSSDGGEPVTATMPNCAEQPTTLGIPPQGNKEEKITWSDTLVTGQHRLIVGFNDPSGSGNSFNFSIQ